MRYFSAAVVALAVGLAPLAAPAQSAGMLGNQPELTVTGSGTVERAPDEARVNVAIVTNNDVASQSAGDNTRIYNTLAARVAKLGIGRDAVRTTFYNVQFIPHPPKGLPPEQQQARYGYVTTRNLTITATPLENVGKVIDAATASGVDQVGDVSFDLRDRKGAYAAALVAAMNDAKSTASVLANAGPFHIVRIRAVQTGYEPGPIRPLALGAQFRVAAAAPAPTPPPTEIAPNGPITVSAQVTVTYDIR